MTSLAILSLVAAKAAGSSARGARSLNLALSTHARLAPKTMPIASSTFSHYESKHVNVASSGEDVVPTTIQALTIARDAWTVFEKGSNASLDQHKIQQGPG